MPQNTKDAPKKKYFRIPKKKPTTPKKAVATPRAKKAVDSKKVPVVVQKKKTKKYEDQPLLEFQTLMESRVDPSQFQTTHLPYYQEHYYYPGYIPFSERNITEEEIDEGLDEKTDNERMRKQLFADRLKIRKRFRAKELRLERNNELIRKVVPDKIDDPEVLNSILVRRLSSVNPRYPKPIYGWNFHYMEYREIDNPPANHEDFIKLIQGLIHRDNKEAQWQIEDENNLEIEIEEEIVEEEEIKQAEEEEEEKPTKIDTVLSEEFSEGLEEEEEEIEEEVKEEEEREASGELFDTGDTDLEVMAKLKLLEDETPIRYGKKSRKLFNLFNFTERGVLAGVTMSASKIVQTIPTSLQRLNAFVCHYIVYDAYQKDMVQKEALEKERAAFSQEEDEPVKPAGPTKERELDESSEEDEVFNEETAHSAKILERIVVQNNLLDCTADYRFYDDPADDIRQEGSLLPLWTFQQEEYKGFLVTCLAFTPNNPDMFGVSYSCSEANRNCPKGVLSVYIIKDPMNPVYEKTCVEPVTAFDYHPSVPGYVAYATSNGNVHCCDTNDPPDSVARALHSNPMEAHLSLVWQVLWDPDPELLHFYTIYADGLFCKWIVGRTSIMKSVAVELHNPDLIQPLKLPCPFGLKENAQPIKDVSIVATTMTFHPNNSNYLMVGTAEGTICKMSLLNLNTYVNIYWAHKLNVLRIQFNYFCNTMFISTGEDRKINIYDEGNSVPLYSFLQKLGVKDVQWAPYSSTVFALITDSSVIVYDLSTNKSSPLCNQLILIPDSGIQLSVFKFSLISPIIMVGDTCGKIVSLKLSPNLRTKAKKIKKQKQIEPFVYETSKLEECMLERRQELQEFLARGEKKEKEPVEEDSDSEEEDYLRIVKEMSFTLPSAQREGLDQLKIAKLKLYEKDLSQRKTKKAQCKREKKK